MTPYIDILEQIEADLEEAITLGPPVDQVELDQIRQQIHQLVLDQEAIERRSREEDLY